MDLLNISGCIIPVWIFQSINSVLIDFSKYFQNYKISTLNQTTYRVIFRYLSAGIRKVGSERVDKLIKEHLIENNSDNSNSFFSNVSIYGFLSEWNIFWI